MVILRSTVTTNIVLADAPSSPIPTVQSCRLTKMLRQRNLLALIFICTVFLFEPAACGQEVDVLDELLASKEFDDIKKP